MNIQYKVNTIPLMSVTQTHTHILPHRHKSLRIITNFSHVHVNTVVSVGVLIRYTVMLVKKLEICARDLALLNINMVGLTKKDFSERANCPIVMLYYN